MPKRSPRPCAQHGWILVADGQSCPLCAEQAGQPSLKQERVDTRASAAQRGYGLEWRQKRDAYARSHPWCEDPFRFHPGVKVKMKIVDHKIPKRLGGKDDESNYQSLCQKCHNYKTAHDGSRRGRGI